MNNTFNMYLYTSKQDKPIFYKKRLSAYKGAFLALAAITTIFAAGFFSMVNITTSDADIARLMGDLKQVDNSLDRLQKSSIFNKAEVAELTIQQTRILLGHMVLTMHKIKSDLERLNGSEG